ncbi:DUF4112 domain-containing protein [Candidatus Laterigemmans baculatus]|uniref:DUF4112 domain-containing protein n=1 Tax=Candidatus Laterigemmans baculatus TaxID=2770505 RepID=UPI0013D8F516|nr:DUF4112 domain-containing protein [Candidatus Laterigemmans baculatus]
MRGRTPHPVTSQSATLWNSVPSRAANPPRAANPGWTADASRGSYRGRAAGTIDSEENLRHLERVERLASLMDEAYRVPGTNYRIGLDGIVGLLPVVGDAVSLGTNAYVIYVAERLGVSRVTLARMLLNAGVDFAIGSIPMVGDLFDVAFKSHLRNLTLLRRSLGRHGTAG